MATPGKLRSKYVGDGLLASRHNMLMEFPAGNFDRYYSFYDDFVSLPVDDSTGDPTAYTIQVVEAGSGYSTATVVNAAGGLLRFTTAGNDNDGVQLQGPEVFKLASTKDLWFGAKVRFGVTTQQDAAIGLCITTTTVTDGVSDGVYFRTVDADAALDFILEKNSTETSTEAVTTLLTATWYVLEFEFDGTGVEGFVDGVSVGAASSTNLPDDEELAITFAYTNGDAASSNMDVDWARSTQLR